MRFGIRLCTALGPLLALVACAGTERPPEDASGLTAVQPSDIPVPDGMKLRSDLKESHSYELGSFRIADLYYYGNLPVADVAQYMTTRMALHGWQLTEESPIGPEQVELTFRRRPHEARCAISKDASVTNLYVSVRTPREP